MIKLSNGHELEYVVASGALAYDGKGWWWERPLVWLGLIKPELFTVVTKSLTFEKRHGNLRWWKPWTCVRPILDGWVNKIGLTNPGYRWFIFKVAFRINFSRQKIIVSLFGNRKELVSMIKTLNLLDIVAFEINDSCPNSGDKFADAKKIIETAKELKKVSRHPLIEKVSVAQDYLAIAEGLVGIVEAISINSVPWDIAFPHKRSPLWRLEKKVGGGKNA
jgi:dihydroorotate dehydrogenase